MAEKYVEQIGRLLDEYEQTPIDDLPGDGSLTHFLAERVSVKAPEATDE